MTNNPARPINETQFAKDIVRAVALGEKNPAAVALGRLGGLKGGKARAEALSKKERTDIARKAADARWRKQ